MLEVLVIVKYRNKFKISLLTTVNEKLAKPLHLKRSRQQLSSTASAAVKEADQQALWPRLAKAYGQKTHRPAV